jgi:cysteine synthase A
MRGDKSEAMKNYGAEVVFTPAFQGMMGAVKEAQTYVKTHADAYYANQFCNPVCAAAHYQTTGPEIWAQTDGKTDIFVAAVGTGGTLTGIGKFLKEKNGNIRIVAVEPQKSPLLSQGRAAAHGIQGIGANFVPAVLDRTIYDEVLTVTDEEAFAIAKLLKREENLYVGISSGANVAAAIALAKREENKGKNIVTVLPDDGGRYASIPQFND